MSMMRLRAIVLTLLALGAPALAQAPVARVGDVTRLQGQGRNVLQGYGLVAGLEKTGDGDKFLPTMKALAAMMHRFGVNLESLGDVGGAKNVAIVMLEVVIPDHGAREGDQLDVAVTAVAAKSLEGGRLLPTPLVYHDRNVEGLFGFAQGRVTVGGPTQTAGVIRGGARMERDVFVNVITTGARLKTTGFASPWIQSDQSYITLVLDEAHTGWSMAAAVAQAVDKELSLSADVERVALAMDSKSIVVLLPEHQRGDPASWIRDVEQTPILMESNEARVTINRNTGTIVISGDTRLSPVVVSQRGMTVTVLNPPDGSVAPRPVLERHDFVALDSARDRQANVRNLLEALNRLKVPFKDRVSILEEIHRAGKLHGKLLYEG
jgi:flagellar P-ring protein precursor FlgI